MLLEIARCDSSQVEVSEQNRVRENEDFLISSRLSFISRRCYELCRLLCLLLGMSSLNFIVHREVLHETERDSSLKFHQCYNNIL